MGFGQPVWLHKEVAGGTALQASSEQASVRPKELPHQWGALE